MKNSIKFLYLKDRSLFNQPNPIKRRTKCAKQSTKFVGRREKVGTAISHFAVEMKHSAESSDRKDPNWSEITLRVSTGVWIRLLMFWTRTGGDQRRMALAAAKKCAAAPFSWRNGNEMRIKSSISLFHTESGPDVISLPRLRLLD